MNNGIDKHQPTIFFSRDLIAAAPEMSTRRAVADKVLPSIQGLLSSVIDLQAEHQLQGIGPGG